MKFHYLRKGSFLIKILKCVRLFQHLIYSLDSRKIGKYDQPTSTVKSVGFFDKNRKVHTNDSYNYLFKSKQIFKDGSFKKMKKEAITLVLINDDLLIRKKYSGFLRLNQFYTELICLNRLQNTGQVPKIAYVDYQCCCIYMEYIQGEVVSKIKNNYNKEKEIMIINNCLSLLNRLHSSGVLFYDARGQNIMLNEKSVFFIDFADSLYFGEKIKKLINKQLKSEKQLMHQELEKYLIFSNK